MTTIIRESEQQPTLSINHCPNKGDSLWTRVRSAVHGTEMHSLNRANPPPCGGTSTVQTPQTNELEPREATRLPDQPREASNCPTNDNETTPQLGAQTREEAGSTRASAMHKENDDSSEDNEGPQQSCDFELDEDMMWEPDTAPCPGTKLGKPKGMKNTKASIKITSLNMRGRGDMTHLEQNKPCNRCFHINQLMRDSKISILLFQETHLTAELQNQIGSVFSKRLHVLNSEDEESPTTVRSLAFILNREITIAEDVTIVNIIPGHTIVLRIPWHLDQELVILGVYAPNKAKENTKFWMNLK
ncbi:hypothetical protein PUNSTDRAFT_46694 [Punctularia strigosozonata HHB-11173 SS5]|uniref:uncharacterized protein n=1 Tax=Punctularia strigosozonata (strain HHB-11173) TaxID=741275 RepID=UPI0004416F32|nr:uncharacterized protein PUNSTDRAFT_46694 [Punctularia strigosozonata HHB-11173 SS5]EIN05874.1 hypothetical protein PUNSTDRAFT_46694 [Punctularia strigosozonata HHB-11173 SS5]